MSSKSRLLAALLLSTGGLASPPGTAEEPLPAKQKVQTLCQICHGMDGVASDSMVPNLSGQHKMYMVIQLEASRRRIVRGLIEEDDSGDGAAPTMASFRERCSGGLTRIRDLVDELKSSDDPGLAALMVAVQAISEQCAVWRREP